MAIGRRDYRRVPSKTDPATVMLVVFAVVAALVFALVLLGIGMASAAKGL